MRTLGLESKRRTQYRKLSGGQKQRLSVALALVGRPRIAMLDELTTGLDPQARREVWALIEGIRDRGVTIVLVTHFMEEAERLCDRVAVLDSGGVAAIDTPSALAAAVGAEQRIRFRPSIPLDDQLLTSLPERRLATTPVGPSRVLAAQLAVNLAVAVTTLIAMLAVARLAFGVALPRQAGGFVLALILTVAALLAVGLFLAAVAPSGRVANGIGAIAFFPMMFFAGLWLPRAEMPSALRDISNFTPLGAAVQALQDSTQDTGRTRSTWPSWPAMRWCSAWPRLDCFVGSSGRGEAAHERGRAG